MGHELAEFMRTIFKRLTSVTLAVTLQLCVACAGSDKLQVTPELLSAYETMSGHGAPIAMDPNIDCYLDFSTGMGEGMRATAAINDQLKNFLGGRSVSCYRIGAESLPTAIALGAPEANFVDLRNFKDAGSKLKVAIDRMTAQKHRVSFFITDFERVEDVTLRQNLAGAPAPHPIDASAWAQTAFRDWLSQGNQIDIFAVPFKKPDQWFDATHKRTFVNWIYTIVLTPLDVARDTSAFKASVAGFLQEQFKKSPPAGAHQFTYNTAAFSIAPSVNASTKTANPNLIVQDSSTTGFARGYEYFAFTSSDLLKFTQDDALTDKRLLTIRISPAVAFLSNVKFGINVSDVTAPLATLDAAQRQAAPEVKKDVETGKADTIANKPQIAKYESGTADEATFDVVYNPEKKELGVKLQPEFVGVKQRTIYKIDVVVASSTLIENPADSVLSLQYTGGYQIRALRESVHLALRDVTAQMSKKALHTFYIDITP